MGMHHDYRKLVQAAVATGEWVRDGRDGQGHGILRHLPTGQTTTYQTHGRASDVNAVRQCAKDIARISGHQLWDRGNRRPSKKVVRGSGYRPERSDAECAAGRRVEQLLAEWHALDAQLQDAEMEGGRRGAHQARKLLPRMQNIERQLAQLRQPPPTRH